MGLEISLIIGGIIIITVYYLNKVLKNILKHKYYNQLIN